MRFTKMHGVGNDFIIINNIEEHIPEERLGVLAKQLCAFHTLDRRRWTDGRNTGEEWRGLRDAVFQFRRQPRRDVRKRSAVHMPLGMRKRPCGRDAAS